MSPPLETLPDRAWYAWHCLPRTGKRGAPPPMKHLEQAAGGVDAIVSPRNPFEAAVQTLILELHADTIASVAAEATGHESERPAHHWGVRLRDRERELHPGKPPKAKKQPAPKVAPKTDAKRKAS